MPRVIHFEIPVNDIERSIAFYERVFDWKFQKWNGPALYYLITTGPANQPGINGGMLKKHDPKQPIANTIQVEDVEACVRSVEENGGKCVMPKMAIQGVGWLAYIIDPEGNLHGIMKTDPGAK